MLIYLILFYINFIVYIWECKNLSSLYIETMLNQISSKHRLTCRNENETFSIIINHRKLNDIIMFDNDIILIAIEIKKHNYLSFDF